MYISDALIVDDDGNLGCTPEVEFALWLEWVEQGCSWAGITKPTHAERNMLRTRWFSFKDPMSGVKELQAMRRPNDELVRVAA